MSKYDAGGFGDFDIRPPDAVVPCRGCRTCCQNPSIVMLLEDQGDDVESYEHEIVELPGVDQIGPAFVERANMRGLVLKRKENGDCVYLGPTGCTIHGRAPAICRVFDCRNLIRGRRKSEVDRMIAVGQLNPEIVERARRLRRKGER